MNNKKALSSRELLLGCGFGLNQFKTTVELKAIELGFSQDRVKTAIQCAMEVHQDGYNVYAAGPSGLGKQKIIAQLLEKIAKKKGPASDWCYVHNFQNQNQPFPIELPTGLGVQFRGDVAQCLGKLKEQIEAQLDLGLILQALENSINALSKKYGSANTISIYLNEFKESLRKDIVNFVKNKIKIPNWKYKINVLITQKDYQKAPIVYESNPNMENLFGKIEYSYYLGTIISNFNMITEGSLHKANGGYLIIDANKLLLKTEVWESLKRVLQTRKISFEVEIKTLEGISFKSIKPRPIPLNTKIILIGNRSIYYLLCDEDQEFNNFFKIIADFNEYLPKTSKNHFSYARFIAAVIQENNLKHLTKSAVVEVIKLNSRNIEDNKKMSLNLNFLHDMLSEANYIAEKSNHIFITKQDVQKAFACKEERSSRLTKQMVEDIGRRYVLMDVKTCKVGQVNGITVDSLGDISFGHPVRITSVARIGRAAEVINIDREVDLSGSIHSKGVLILSGYLRGKYLLKQSLSISASIVFEQTYESVDGDSASLAELISLLSAISEIPVHQSIAITGSVNQHGEVQAVSGLNLKIEGFFDICRQKGLTKSQGVIIPNSNIQNLVLKDEVTKAIVENKFHIYPVKNVDEAISIVAAIPAGRRSKYGYFPINTFNFNVEQKLKEFTKEMIDEKTGDISETEEPFE